MITTAAPPWQLSSFKLFIHLHPSAILILLHLAAILILLLHPAAILLLLLHPAAKITASPVLYIWLQRDSI